MHVKAHNMRKGDDHHDKLTVMKYLNNQKAKMEQTNDRINDQFIQEVDEYSEEDHSESGMYDNNRKGGGVNFKASKTGVGIGNSEFDIGTNRFRDENSKNMQKRINDIINARYIPHVETADTMYQRI